uniref:Uncharacterized protein n=1 Tax=Trypanosoma congolense (strain IL3000) TaxID=1068625 RepID=G0ULE5_TRYCI|nr:hypothetical protein, unlikely [Trypanosoma congolense IL3000]
MCALCGWCAHVFLVVQAPAAGLECNNRYTYMHRAIALLIHIYIYGFLLSLAYFFLLLLAHRWWVFLQYKPRYVSRRESVVTFHSPSNGIADAPPFFPKVKLNCCTSPIGAST